MNRASPLTPNLIVKLTQIGVILAVGGNPERLQHQSHREPSWRADDWIPGCAEDDGPKKCAV